MVDAKDLVEVTTGVLARLAASVEVVTAVDNDGTPHGMTISSLVQVSTDPPSVLMCIGPLAEMQPLFVPGFPLCVNVLAPGQVDHSVGFAFGDEDPFEVFEWREGPGGIPLLDGVAAHLLCEVEDTVMHHDTKVVMMKVTGGRIHADNTLIYWMRSYYRDLIPSESDVRGDW